LLIFLASSRSTTIPSFVSLTATSLRSSELAGAGNLLFGATPSQVKWFAALPHGIENFLCKRRLVFGAAPALAAQSVAPIPLGGAFSLKLGI
jgi:hypothetical protein